MSELAEPIHLSPEAAIHDLRTLLASAPSLRRAFEDFDDGDYERYQDAARTKADWCIARAVVDDGYDRELYLLAARLLRAAMPGLPAHAPPEAHGIRRTVDEDYSESVATADRAYARKKRRAR